MQHLGVGDENYSLPDSIGWTGVKEEVPQERRGGGRQVSLLSPKGATSEADFIVAGCGMRRALPAIVAARTLPPPRHKGGSFLCAA